MIEHDKIKSQSPDDRINRSTRMAEILARLEERQKQDMGELPRRVIRHRPIYNEEQSIVGMIATRKGELDNESFEQDIRLKKHTLFILFGFLAVETVAIFTVAFFQGFETVGFSLEDGSFRILTGATITQITVMLLVAVQHLFPKK